ncbi:MAG: alpha/beta hydrolase [Eubacteriaceae bacterium]|nr:alpha/beta hydrolase [Eubacteriaceae bacterium]
MKYVEFAHENSDVIILLHGGGMNWWNYREVSQILSERFRVILPVLDGHAGSDRHFTSIEDNASEIIGFIDDNLGSRVMMIGGLSLGAQIMLEMLSQRSDICSFALCESAMVIPSRVTNALVAPAFGSSYGLIRNRSFSRMQFNSYRLKEELFEDYYRDSCVIEKSDLISFMKANTSYELKDTFSGCTAKLAVYAGEKETSGIRRSAEKIAKALPGSALSFLPGLTHGQFSMNCPEKYAEAVKELIES